VKGTLGEGRRETLTDSEFQTSLVQPINDLAHVIFFFDESAVPIPSTSAASYERPDGRVIL
jgi:hypothetical protein